MRGRVKDSLMQRTGRPKLVALGLSLSTLALSLAPRNERAIFVLPPTPVAFAALPTPNPVYSYSESGVPGNHDGVAGPGRPGFGLEGNPLAPLAVPGEASPFGMSPVSFAPNGPVFSYGSGLPLLPSGLPDSGGSGVPALPFTGPVGIAPIAAATPPPVITPPPVGPPSPPALVSGVPEPTTWLLLIAGFAAVGANLRRSRSRKLGHAGGRG